MPKKLRRWFQFRLRTLFMVTAIVALVLGITLHYRVHLLWRFFAARQGLTDVRPVPVSPMPEEPLPKGWVACRFGSLYFSIPPGLAKNPQAAPNGRTLLVLGEAGRSMIVTLPTASSDMSAFLQTDMAMPPEGQGLSPVRLRLACFQTDSDEFRWSMSPEEFRWFVWRVAVGRLMRLGSEQRAETLIRGDMEGVAYFRTRHVEFDWQAKDGQAGGYIHFIDRSEEHEIEPAWVRAVCRSLKFSGQCLPDRMPADKVKAQFQIITK